MPSFIALVAERARLLSAQQVQTDMNKPSEARFFALALNGPNRYCLVLPRATG
jgi:hypothetical protein